MSKAREMRRIQQKLTPLDSRSSDETQREVVPSVARIWNYVPEGWDGERAVYAHRNVMILTKKQFDKIKKETEERLNEFIHANHLVCRDAFTNPPSLKHARSRVLYGYNEQTHTGFLQIGIEDYNIRQFEPVRYEVDMTMNSICHEVGAEYVGSARDKPQLISGLGFWAGYYPRDYDYTPLRTVREKLVDMLRGKRAMTLGEVMVKTLRH